MTTLLGFVAVVYGTSMVIVAGGGVLWAISPRFRRLFLDERKPL